MQYSESVDHYTARLPLLFVNLLHSFATRGVFLPITELANGLRFECRFKPSPAEQAGQKPAASAPPRLSSNDALTRPLPTRPTTYDDLPSELIARIGDYVPIQDVMPFATVDRRTYHAMQTRRLVHRYWQRANQAVSLASVNQLLDEIGGALSNPAQYVEPIDALSQRLQALPEAERVEAFKRVFAAAERIPRDGVQIQKALLRAFLFFLRAGVLNYSTLLMRWRNGARPGKTISGRNWLTVCSSFRSAHLLPSSVIRRSWLGLRR
ncbi:MULTISPECIES: hypothetical protein [Burkholderiaceae]|uniref:hypothetical protein n=1 Tax=Burkholderiaceae TaxID=119060 RepID=UPI0030CD5EA1